MGGRNAIAPQARLSSLDKFDSAVNMRRSTRSRVDPAACATRYRNGSSGIAQRPATADANVVGRPARSRAAELAAASQVTRSLRGLAHESIAGHRGAHTPH